MLLPRPIAVLSKAIKHSRHIHHHPTLPSSTIQLSRHIAFSTKELRSKSPLRRPQSTSKMSNKPIPKLPPGSWDSHVHVIDEVSPKPPLPETHPHPPSIPHPTTPLTKRKKKGKLPLRTHPPLPPQKSLPRLPSLLLKNPRNNPPRPRKHLSLRHRQHPPPRLPAPTKRSR